jgi:hypothetical protein
MIFAMHICRSRFLLLMLHSCPGLIQEGLSKDTEDTSTARVFSLVCATTLLLQLEHLQFLLSLCGSVGDGRVNQWSKSGR